MDGTIHPISLYEITNWQQVFEKSGMASNPKMQAMSCEGACVHAHVRCAVPRVRVRAKSIMESVRDVCACGPFLGVRCATALLHTFSDKITRKCYFLKKKNYSRTRMSYPVLEHLFLLWNILSCFRTSYSDLEHPILFLNTKKHKINCWKKFEKMMKNCWKMLVRVRSATTSNWVCA